MSEEQNKMLDEVNRFKLYERPVLLYDANMSDLQLRYSSVHVHKVVRKEMRLPTLSFARTFTHGECLCTKLKLCFLNKFINEFLINR